VPQCVEPARASVDHPPPPLPVCSQVPAYFTYVSGAAHRDRLRNLFKYSAPHYLPGVGAVAISLQECYYADPDAIEAAGDLIGELQREGIAVFLLGFHSRVREVLEFAHWFHAIEHFPDYGALLAHLRTLQTEGRLPVRPPPPPRRATKSWRTARPPSSSTRRSAAALETWRPWPLLLASARLLLSRPAGFTTALPGSHWAAEPARHAGSAGPTAAVASALWDDVPTPAVVSEASQTDALQEQPRRDQAAPAAGESRRDPAGALDWP